MPTAIAPPQVFSSVAADDGHVGRDAAIGAGAGLLLGLAFGFYDAQSGPRIGISTDRSR